MGMKIVGFIVIFGNYPSEKAFLLSTMDIYHNDELMTPCDEIMDADKQKICYYELRIKQQETNWVALMKDTHWKRDHNTSDLIKQIGGPIVSAKWDILQVGFYASVSSKRQCEALIYSVSIKKST